MRYRFWQWVIRKAFFHLPNYSMTGVSRADIANGWDPRWKTIEQDDEK